MSSRLDVEDLLKEPSELGKQGCAIALRKALARSPRFRTIREVADAASENYSTVKHYFEARYLPGRERWAKIASVLLPEIGATESVPKKRSSGPPSEGLSAARAAEVLRVLRRLAQVLEFFKTGSPTDRDLLRRMVPGTDVGYITSLLRALYDEDRFEEWILFSNYTMRGTKHGSSGNRR